MGEIRQEIKYLVEDITHLKNKSNEEIIKLGNIVSSYLLDKDTDVEERMLLKSNSDYLFMLKISIECEMENNKDSVNT